MNPKYIFFICLIFLGMYLSTPAFSKTENESLVQTTILDPENDYEIVYEDGAWWMIIYCDGEVVTRVPMEE